MNPEVKKRLKWIEVYEQTKNAGMTSLRCGISRPTLPNGCYAIRQKELQALKVEVAVP